MALDFATLGRRLRAARENASITQEAAAEAIGMPRTALVHIEAGRRSISTVELSDLARLYKRPVAEFFEEERADEEDALAMLFRLAPEFHGNKDVRDRVERCVRICKEGASLEDLLGRDRRSGPPSYSLPSPATTADAVAQGSRVAADERKRLDLSDAPIADMSELVSMRGVWASGTTLPTGVSGVFLRHSTFGMAVLVNHGESRQRKRFSYAHEYGHVLMDRDQAASVTAADNRRDLREVRANAFAAAFLIPPGGAAKFLASLDKAGATRRTHPVYDLQSETSASAAVEARHRAAPGSQTITAYDIAELALHFDVSYQAAVYRLNSLGYLNRDNREAMLAREEIANQYKKALDLEDVGIRSADRELEHEIAYLAIEAFRREIISSGKLRDLGRLLNLDADMLVQAAEAAV